MWIKLSDVNKLDIIKKLGQPGCSQKCTLNNTEMYKVYMLTMTKAIIPVIYRHSWFGV